MNYSFELFNFKVLDKVYLHNNKEREWLISKICDDGIMVEIVSGDWLTYARKTELKRI